MTPKIEKSINIASLERVYFDMTKNISAKGQVHVNK